MLRDTGAELDSSSKTFSYYQGNQILTQEDSVGRRCIGSVKCEEFEFEAQSTDCGVTEGIFSCATVKNKLCRICEEMIFVVWRLAVVRLNLLQPITHSLNFFLSFL